MKKNLRVLVSITLCCSFSACTRDNKLTDYETKLSNKSDNIHTNSKNEVKTEVRRHNCNTTSDFVFSNKIFSSMEDFRDM
nr:hypothetical protein [uncultured Allomuricauda sp.]